MTDPRLSELLLPLVRAHREHHAFLRRRFALLGVPDDAFDDAAQDASSAMRRRGLHASWRSYVTVSNCCSRARACSRC